MDYGSEKQALMEDVVWITAARRLESGRQCLDYSAQLSVEPETWKSSDRYGSKRYAFTGKQSSCYRYVETTGSGARLATEGDRVERYS